MAQREGTDLRYIHQDHLSDTSLMTDEDGDVIGSPVSYFPFGSARSGDVPTDKKFTGQRWDDTGLYYYGARYYDPETGRFISPDPIVPYPANPQSFNRYAYCLNNPLRYVDPTGHYTEEELLSIPGIGSVDVDKVIDLVEGAEDNTEPDLPIDDTSNLVQQIASTLGLTATDASILVKTTSIGTLMEIISAAGPWAAVGIVTGVGIYANQQITSSDEFTLEEKILLICGPEALYVYSKNTERGVKSHIDRILEHQDKIANNPGDPHRPDWEKHIEKACREIVKKLNTMGPVAKQRAVEMLEKYGIELLK